MDVKSYIKHTHHILQGLESLQTLENADIPNFDVHGILIYDVTREAFDIVSIRELTHTFKSEFQEATQYISEGGDEKRLL